MHDEPELLTAQQVAARLLVSGATVTRWARTGRLRALRLPGGTLRFRRVDIERLLRDDNPEPEAVGQ